MRVTLYNWFVVDFFGKKTGFRDPGSGLDIADFLLEPGSDEAYRDQLHPWMGYRFGTPEHGQRAKRMVEGPQIYTRALELAPRVIEGNDFCLTFSIRLYSCVEVQNGRLYRFD